MAYLTPDQVDELKDEPKVTKPQDLGPDADDWQKFAASCWECSSLEPRKDLFFCDRCQFAKTLKAVVEAFKPENMTISLASAYYIKNCATDELVEFAFDAQRSLTLMVNDHGLTDSFNEADYQSVKQYKLDIKAEIVARVGVGYEPGMANRGMVLCDSYGKPL